MHPALHLAVSVHAHQSQRGPGELKGFEVQRRAARSLAFNGGFLPNPLRGTGGTVEHTHCVQGKTVEDLNTAIMERQSKTCTYQREFLKPR